MYWYEVVYEDGSMSKMMCESDEKAFSGLKVQNDRAKNGIANGPQGGTAIRIAKVFRYDQDPGEYAADGGISADVLLKELSTLVGTMTDKNGVVHIGTFAAAVRGIGSPFVTGDGTEHAHDTRYKMEGKELSLAALDADTSEGKA